MEGIVLPKIIQYVKTETLDKGRVRTRLFMFMIDDKVFDSMAASIITGELSFMEARVGTTIKHPKDKYDKKIALAEAAKKIKKYKLPVTLLTSTPNKASKIWVDLGGGEQLIIIKTANNKILIDILKRGK